MSASAFLGVENNPILTKCQVPSDLTFKTPALTLPQAQKLIMVVLPLASLNTKQALEIIR